MLSLKAPCTDSIGLVTVSVASLSEAATADLAKVGFYFEMRVCMIQSVAPLAEMLVAELAGENASLSARSLVDHEGDVECLVNQFQISSLWLAVSHRIII